MNALKSSFRVDFLQVTEEERNTESVSEAIMTPQMVDIDHQEDYYDEHVNQNEEQSQDQWRNQAQKQGCLHPEDSNW